MISRLRTRLEQRVIFVKHLVERERFEQGGAAGLPSALQRDVVVECSFFSSQGSPDVTFRYCRTPFTSTLLVKLCTGDRSVPNQVPRCVMLVTMQTVPADESAGSLEILVDARRLVAIAEMPAVAVRPRPARSAPRIVPAADTRPAHRAPAAARCRCRSKEQPRVAAEHAVRVAAVDAVGIDEADLRRATQLTLQPRDVEHRMIAAASPTPTRRRPRTGSATSVARRFAGELRRRERRDDAARVDQVVRRRELLDAVEEERPLLGEEQRLARIEHELARRRTRPARSPD